MKTLLKYKGSLLAIVLFVGAIYVYNTWFSADDFLVPPERGVAARQTAAELIATLTALQAVNFDTSILSSPLYRLLTDFTVTLPQQPVGRPNPFGSI